MALAMAHAAALGLAASSACVARRRLQPCASGNGLESSFLAPASTCSMSSVRAFSGSLSLCVDTFAEGVRTGVRRLVITGNAKKSLGCTKSNASRKKRARVHGFLKRMKTRNGRKVLARRKAKGRWYLCTQTCPKFGKKRNLGYKRRAKTGR